MNYKLVALDMDGTLLQSDKTIADTTKQAISAAIARGVRVVLCTGRPIQGVEKYLQQLPPLGAVITYNGAEIVDAATRRVLYSQRLAANDAQQILRLGERYDTTMCIWCDNALYGNRLDERMTRYKQLSGVEPQLMTDSRTLCQKGIVKVLWYDDVVKINAMQRQLQDYPFERVTCCTSQPQYLEFFSSLASKALAMQALGQWYGIDRAQMIAIGDGQNDISMLQYAGLGVAMGNADSEVKAAADCIAEDNDHDGVGATIRKYILV